MTSGADHAFEDVVEDLRTELRRLQEPMTDAGRIALDESDGPSLSTAPEASGDPAGATLGRQAQWIAVPQPLSVRAGHFTGLRRALKRGVWRATRWELDPLAASVRAFGASTATAIEGLRARVEDLERRSPEEHTGVDLRSLDEIRRNLDLLMRRVSMLEQTWREVAPPRASEAASEEDAREDGCC